MKVLTVKQPWASLIIRGAKDIENRNWYTGIRGRVGIHSSGRMDTAEFEAASDLMAQFILNFSRRVFLDEMRNCPEKYPLGAILGTVEIVGCVRQSQSPWFVGEYGFVLRDPVALPEPISVPGKLGFWDYPLEVEKT